MFYSLLQFKLFDIEFSIDFNQYFCFLFNYANYKVQLNVQGVCYKNRSLSIKYTSIVLFCQYTLLSDIQ